MNLKTTRNAWFFFISQSNSKVTRSYAKKNRYSFFVNRNLQQKWLICYSVIWLFSEWVTIFFTTKETKFLQKTQSFSLSIKRNPQLKTYNIKWLICYSVIWLFSESVTIFFTTKEKKFLQKTQSFSLSIKRNLQLTTYNPQLTTHNIQHTTNNWQPTTRSRLFCWIAYSMADRSIVQFLEFGISILEFSIYNPQHTTNIGQPPTNNSSILSWNYSNYYQCTISFTVYSSRILHFLWKKNKNIFTV